MSSKTDNNNNLPTLILIHGSWHRPNCFDPLIAHLTPTPFPNQKCIPIALPSSNSFSPDPTFSDDLSVAVSTISAEISSGRDVVIIAHSYGGMVGCSAIRDFVPSSSPSSSSSSSQHQKKSDDGKILGLILISSGFALTGHSMLSLFPFDITPPGQRMNRVTGFEEITGDPRDMFYHDVEESEYWASQLTTQSLRALTEGGELVYSGWKHVPTWYLGSSRDRALPLWLQRFTVGMARGMTSMEIQHRELPSSHSPFLSMPGTTARVIMEAVGAFMGREVLRTAADDGVEAEVQGKKREEGIAVVVPQVKLWRLGTWFKFGIPIGFGFLVGRGILFFGRIRGVWRSVFN